MHSFISIKHPCILLSHSRLLLCSLSSAVVKLCCCSFWLVLKQIHLREALWGGLRLFHRLWEERWTSVTLRWTRERVDSWLCFWNILKDWQNWISVTANSLITAWSRCCHICTKPRLWSELQRQMRNREKNSIQSYGYFYYFNPSISFLLIDWVTIISQMNQQRESTVLSALTAIFRLYGKCVRSVVY